MKLLFVCNEYPPVPHGGIGAFVYSAAHMLKKSGCQVLVIGYDPTVEETGWYDDDGVMVYRICNPYRVISTIHLSHFRLNPTFVLERMYLSKQVDQLIETQKIDLVESFDWGGPLWWRPRVPLVIRLHGANTAHAYYQQRKPSRLLRFVEKRNLALTDKYIAVTRHIGQLTKQTFAMNNARFTVIYNGVDTRVFAPNPASDRRNNMILYAGSIHPRKGIFELFEAMRLVFRQYPAAQLILAGRLTEDSSEIQKDLLSRIPDEFHTSVQFLGNVPFKKMPELYNHATLAVFPSLAEAFGLTCAEAMACGTPVVMTSRASGPEIVEDKISGMLADPKKPAELADAILRVLDDAELRESLSCNAVRQVRERFALPVIIQQNMHFYQNLIQ
jgi:glycosyltransferase involved in cell wall biosynthesis